MKALVTGASGFIGSRLCAHLVRHGIAVAGLVRPESSLWRLGGAGAVRLVQGELGDRSALMSAMQGIDVVFHAAALVSDWGRWEDFRATNVDGVENVIEAARRAGVRRIVHLSSVSVYGFPGGVQLNEEAAVTTPSRDAYIRSKREGEQLTGIANGRGIETVIIRPAGVFGPGDCTTTLSLAQALAQGKFAFVDAGRHIMAPVYVDNLVELIRLAGECGPAAGQAFNAVDDGVVSWREYIEWFCAELACDPPRLSLPASLAWQIATGVEAAARMLRTEHSPIVNRFRLRAVMQDNHYANDKAKTLLGWTPAIATREGVRRAALWCRSRLRGGIDEMAVTAS